MVCFSVGGEQSSFLWCVSASVTSSQAFRGLILQAVDDTGRARGHFLQSSPVTTAHASLSFVTCSYADDTVLTWMGDAVSSVNVTWRLDGERNTFELPVQFV